MEFERYSNRNDIMTGSYTPGPGYYGSTRNPVFSDQYKQSFVDLFREKDGAEERALTALKGYKFRPEHKNRYIPSKDAKSQKEQLKELKAGLISQQQYVLPGPGEYHDLKCVDKYHLKRAERLKEKKATLEKRVREGQQMTRTPTIPGNGD